MLFAALKGMFAEELGWTDDHWQSELARYQAIWRYHYSLPQGEPVSKTEDVGGD